MSVKLLFIYTRCVLVDFLRRGLCSLLSGRDLLAEIKERYLATVEQNNTLRQDESSHAFTAQSLHTGGFNDATRGFALSDTSSFTVTGRGEKMSFIHTWRLLDNL